MTFEAGFVLAVTAATLLLFVTEFLPVDLVGLLVIVALVLGGVLSPEEGLSGFSNSALITIACMFVLSGGLIRTGALEVLSGALFALARGSKVRFVVALMLAVAIGSAFINNTPVAVIFLPIVLDVAARFEIAPSRLLLPMSYASVLGGTCTLIGTSTNLLVSQAAEKNGLPALGMFEMTAPGIIYAIVGFLYLATLGRRLLPKRASVSAAMKGGKIKEFVTEIQFDGESTLVGKSFQEVVSRVPGITPLMVIRGEETHMAPLRPNPKTQFIRPDDVLLLRGDPSSINALVSREGITLPSELGELIDAPGAGKSMTMVELVINPNSPLIGRTMAAVQFSRRHGNAAVIAILRRDEHLRKRPSEIRLRMGDTLLVACDEAHLEDLRNTDEFILLEGVAHEMLRRDKAPIAVAIMAGLVIGATLGVLPIATLALTAVVLMILTGCLPLRIAYQSIDSTIVVLIAGMLALGVAMQNVGIATMAGDGLVDALRDYGPMWVLGGIYLLSMITTSVVTNNAVAVLITPIAIEAARSLGAHPAPFVFAVLFGASACFATPIGYQTNLFVYGPGGYRFTDYLRLGVPLNFILMAVAMAVIPFFWPLFG